MAALRAMGGSAEGDALAPHPAVRHHCAQPHALGPTPAALAAPLPAARALVAKLPASLAWPPGAPLAVHSVSSSGDRHGSGLVSGRKETLAGDEAQCATRTEAAAPAEPEVAAPQPPERRGQSGVDAKDGGTPPLGSETAGPATAAPTPTPASAAPPPPCALLPQQLQQLYQQQQLQLQQIHPHIQIAAPALTKSPIQPRQQQLKSRGSHRNACGDGGSHASQRTAGPQPPRGTCAGAECGSPGAAAAAAAAASASPRRSRAPRSPETRGPSGNNELAQEVVAAAGGGGGAAGRVRSRKSTARRHSYELPEEEEEADPEAESSKEEEGEEHEGMGGAGVKAGREGGEGREDEREERRKEHMPGCFRCRFALAGCGSCRARPLASRPYARWQPEGARFQVVPSAPVFFPTPEDFAEGPLSYIAKIRPEAEKYGICRIVPPSCCWDPPLALLGPSGGAVGAAGTGEEGADGGGHEWFRFQPRKQVTSHLCMRPCGSGDTPRPVQAPEGRPQQAGQQQQLGAAAAEREQAFCAGQMGRMCMSSVEGLAGANTGGSRHPGSAHHQQQQQRRQQQHPPKLERERKRNQQWHNQQRDSIQPQRDQQQQQQRQQQHEQCKHQPAARNSRMGDSAAGGGGGGCSGPARTCTGGPRGWGPHDSHPGADITLAGIRLVAPGGSRSQPRPPGAAVEPSLERYVAGLGAHPLLGLDEAAAAAAAAALSAAATGEEGRSSRATSARPKARGSSFGTDGKDLSRSPTGSDLDSDVGLGSSPDSDVGGELRFSSSERTHTLRSFQAYCQWARSLHFGLPPFGDRYGPGASGGAAAAAAVVASTAAALPPRVQAALDRAAAGSEPSLEEVEAEFWRIVERPTADLAVETLYGSGFESSSHGSGFPLPPWRAPSADTRRQQAAAAAGAVAAAAFGPPPPPLDERWRHYARHPWNINNLPLARGSLLRYIETDELIPGVMASRLHVGSCLSASCWHVEDHDLYSVSYLHTAEPKVWYGVPAQASAQFEAAVRDAVPQLFAEDPLLLHRRMTHISPSELRRRGVPVCRLVQEAGSFVVTFPNAYHAGLDTGFSVAEAVNVAPADWLPFGSDAARRYRRQGSGRGSFSHDALLLRLVAAAPAVSAAARLGAMTSHAPQPTAPPSPQSPLASGQMLKMEFNEAAPTGIKHESGIAAVASVAASGGNDYNPPYSWMAGLRLAEVPPAAVCAAVGELALRVEEEEAWRHAATREFGVTQERPMSGLPGAKDEAGVPALGAAAACLACKCDLHLSAVVSAQLPGAAACPEHAAGLGAPPEACVLLARHSMEQLRALIDSALELFPEAHAAIAAARRRLATPPLAAIRRLGPVSRYGLPYSAPLDEQDARDAVSEAVCAVAGPPSDEPYVPYDFVSGAAAGEADAALREDKFPAAAAAAAAAAEVKLKEKAVASATQQPQQQIDAIATAESASSRAAGAAAAERERLGPRQALFLEEQQAEAERREEQRQSQESMRRARAQRAARRSTAAAGGSVGGGGAGQTPPSSASARTPPAALAAPAKPVLCVPAVAVIAPMPVRPPPVVLTSTGPPLSTPTDMKLPTMSIVGVSPAAGAAAASIPTPPAERAPPPGAATATPAAGLPPDQAAAAVVHAGTKRSCRAAIAGQTSAAVATASAAAEGERAVRPRRERRVPKHLLDAEMELAAEMQQVVAGAAAASAAAAPPPPLPKSPPLPVSPPADARAAAAASPDESASPVIKTAAAVAAAPKAHGSSSASVTGTASSSSSQQGPEPAPPHQPALKQQRSFGAESAPALGEAVALAAGEGVQAAGGSPAAATAAVVTTGPTTQVPPADVDQRLRPQATGTTAAAALLPLLPLQQLPQPQEPRPQTEEQQHQQQEVGKQQPEQGPRQQPQHALQLQPFQQQLQLLEQLQQLQQLQLLHQQSQPQSQLKQQGAALGPHAAAPGPALQPAAAAAPAHALAPTPLTADGLGASPRRSSRPTRPSVRLMSVTGGGCGAGGGSGMPAATAAAATTTPPAPTPAITAMATAGGAKAVAGPAPAPGVLLLRRETTSGPSTSSLRGGHAASARRLSLGLPGASAPGGLPPTAAAAVAPAAAPVQPPRPSAAKAANAAWPPQAAHAAAADTAPSQISTTGHCADPGSGSSAGEAGFELSDRRPGLAHDASALAGPQEVPPVGDTQPLLEATAVPPTRAAPAAAAAPDAEGASGIATANHLGRASFNKPQSITTAVPTVPLPAARPDAAPQPAKQQQRAPAVLPPAHPPPGPPASSRANGQPDGAPAAASFNAAAAAVPTTATAAGRPVRKRKTTLSNDMVIYGESAALFGAAAGGTAKRKSSGDRRSAAAAGGGSATASATASGGAAGSAVGSAGAGSSAEAPERQADGAGEGEVRDEQAAAAVRELEDTHASLAAPFAGAEMEEEAAAEEELRSMSCALLPPHDMLFGHLHHLNHAATPSSPPMALPLPHLSSGLAVLGHGHGHDHAPAGGADAGADGAPHLAAAGLGLLIGPSAPHSPDHLLCLHGHDHGHDHDQDDVFLADGGRGLALSASPSVNALETLTAAMMLPGDGGGGAGGGVGSGDSPRLAAGYGGIAQAEAAQAGAAAAVAASQPSMQTVLVNAVVAAGFSALGAPVPELGSLEVAAATGHARAANAAASAAAHSHPHMGVGAALVGVSGWLPGASCICAGDYTAAGGGGGGFAPAMTPLAAWDAQGQGGVAEREACAAQPLAAAASFNGSRQGLSSMSANAAAEWADLDDLVVL